MDGNENNDELYHAIKPTANDVDSYEHFFPLLPNKSDLDKSGKNTYWRVFPSVTYIK